MCKGRPEVSDPTPTLPPPFCLPANNENSTHYDAVHVSMMLSYMVYHGFTTQIKYISSILVCKAQRIFSLFEKMCHGIHVAFEIDHSQCLQSLHQIRCIDLILLAGTWPTMRMTTLYSLTQRRPTLKYMYIDNCKSTATTENKILWSLII